MLLPLLSDIFLLSAATNTNWNEFSTDDVVIVIYVTLCSSDTFGRFIYAVKCSVFFFASGLYGHCRLPGQAAQSRHDG